MGPGQRLHGSLVLGARISEPSFAKGRGGATLALFVYVIVLAFGITGRLWRRIRIDIGSFCRGPWAFPYLFIA
jgi:hypothetical protein